MSAASEPPATPAPHSRTLAGMYALLRQQRPIDWLPLSFGVAGLLILIADLVVIDLVFDSHIPPAFFPVFQAVQVAVFLCLLACGLLSLRRLQPWWVRVLPTIGMVGLYVSVLAMVLSGVFLPIPTDRTLFQAANTLGLLSFGVLALSVPVGVVALARYARRLRSDGGPNRAT